MKKTEKSWGKTHLLQLIDVSSCSDDFECIPSKVEITSSVLRQWAIKTQPLSNCMLLACAYQSAKENGHCQIKILPRLWTTIWQRKAVWKTLFQNKSGGTINPVYLPQTTPEQNKEGVNKNTLSISNLAQYFILQLMRNVPWTTMTSIELRLLNTCCITQKVRCWGGNNQKDTAKEQGHGRKTYKVFSLNSFLLIWGR